jgi:HD-like signal output (HDOD) protein
MRRLDQWVRSLGGYNLPVLQRSVHALAVLRLREDSVTARDIAELVLRDPFLTLKVLRFSQARLTGRQPTEVTTVEHALMMHGVASFFRQFRDLVSLEDTLAAHPAALQGALAVASRAHHAAVNARTFSALRHDMETEEVLISALLHDLAEMLLWCAGPALAIQIQRMVLSTPGLRSASAQRAVLGFALGKLQVALAREWRLPKLLQDLMDDRQAGTARVRTVHLSVSLARHSAHGWHDPGLPDDFAGLQKLVSLPDNQVKRWVRQTALQAARHWRDFNVQPAAAWLPMLPGAWPIDQESSMEPGESGEAAALFARCLEQLDAAGQGTADPLAVVSIVFYGLQAGLGLRRCWYGAVNTNGRVEALAQVVADDPDLSRELGFALASPHLFARLTERAQAVWYGAANQSRLAPLLPETIRQRIGSREFFAMGLHVGGSPSSLIYADPGDAPGGLDESRYNAFKQICAAAGQALEHLST